MQEKKARGPGSEKSPVTARRVHTFEERNIQNSVPDPPGLIVGGVRLDRHLRNLIAALVEDLDVALYRRGWNVLFDLLCDDLRLGVGVLIVPAIQPGRVFQSLAIGKVEIISGAFCRLQIRQCKL